MKNAFFYLSKLFNVYGVNTYVMSILLSKNSEFGNKLFILQLCSTMQMQLKFREEVSTVVLLITIINQNISSKFKLD